MGNERRKTILELLELKGEITLQELKEKLSEVSEMTLRRDLIALEEDRFLKRTHGGAVSLKLTGQSNGEEDAYSLRASEQTEAKLAIAEKALELVEVNRSLYFDAGSTMMCLAKKLPDEQFSIICAGINVALELVKHQKVSVLQFGGQVNRNTLSTSGPHALSFIQSVNIDIAFMSASAFSLDSGFSVSNIYEAEVKKLVVQKAKKVVMLVDSSKVGSSMTFSFCSLADVDIWVSDDGLPEEIKKTAAQKAVHIL